VNSNPRFRFPFVAKVLCVWVCAAIPTAAQGQRLVQAAAVVPQNPATLKRDFWGHPDLNGMWDNQYTPNIATAVVGGGDIPFTPHGMQRFKDVDTAKDPTGFCLPMGPSRAFTSPFPAYFVTSPKMIAVLFEYQTTYRMIYIDGTHPGDLGDYGSEFMGHSTGKWEGDVLVVDTIGINDRSWLDTAGHEHSDKLHLTERFEKINDDNVQYSATFDDPVFFSKPFTISRNFKRAKEIDRILPYSCEENNIDVPHLVPNKKPDSQN
jgi:hypothetical protein